MVDQSKEVSASIAAQNNINTNTSIQTEKNDQSDSYYYLRNPFPKEAKRVVDVIKRKTLVEGADRKVDRLEGKLALAEAKDGFKQAERIFISITTEPIGDAVISTGYVEAVRQALRLQGRELPITLVVSRHHGGLFDGYKNQGIEVIQADAGTGREISTALSSLAPEKKFAHTRYGKVS